MPFTDEQIALLRTFADQAAIAVANARLMEKTSRLLPGMRVTVSFEAAAPTDEKPGIH